MSFSSYNQCSFHVGKSEPGPLVGQRVDQAKLLSGKVVFWGGFFQYLIIHLTELNVTTIVSLTRILILVIDMGILMAIAFGDYHS